MGNNNIGTLYCSKMASEGLFKDHMKDGISRGRLYKTRNFQNLPAGLAGIVKMPHSKTLPAPLVLMQIPKSQHFSGETETHLVTKLIFSVPTVHHLSDL